MSGPLLEQYRDIDFDQMKAIERELVAVLLPFRENTDPLLGVIALARVLRTMLRLGPDEAQQKLLPVLVAFIQGKTAPPGSGRIWMPER